MLGPLPLPVCILDLMRWAGLLYHMPLPWCSVPPCAWITKAHCPWTENMSQVTPFFFLNVFFQVCIIVTGNRSHTGHPRSSSQPWGSALCDPECVLGLFLHLENRMLELGEKVEWSELIAELRSQTPWTLFLYDKVSHSPGCFQTRCLSEDNIECPVLFPLPPQCGDYRCAAPHWVLCSPRDETQVSVPVRQVLCRMSHVLSLDPLNSNPGLPLTFWCVNFW